jgi:hypothetical protein
MTALRPVTWLQSLLRWRQKTATWDPISVRVAWAIAGLDGPVSFDAPGIDFASGQRN